MTRNKPMEFVGDFFIALYLVAFAVSSLSLYNGWMKESDPSIVVVAAVWITFIGSIALIGGAVLRWAHDG